MGVKISEFERIYDGSGLNLDLDAYIPIIQEDNIEDELTNYAIKIRDYFYTKNEIENIIAGTDTTDLESKVKNNETKIGVLETEVLVIKDNIADLTGRVEKLENKKDNIYVSNRIGSHWISFDGTIPSGGLEFNGEQYSKEVYESLWNWVSSKEELLITENDWNLKKAENENYVPYYCECSNGTFRLPIITSGYIKADAVSGKYIPEGLPNITGSIGHGHSAKRTGRLGAFNSDTANGAFYQDLNNWQRGQYYPDWNGGSYSVELDASRSNSIYGKSEHVTPETITVKVGVYAFQEITTASSINLEKIETILKSLNTIDSMPLLMSHWDRKNLSSVGWVKADCTWISGDTYKDAYKKICTKLENGDLDVKSVNYAAVSTMSDPDTFLVDTTNKKFRLPYISKERVLVAKKDTTTDDPSWYELYSDGHLIQGGQVTGGSGYRTEQLNLRYKNTNYYLGTQNGIIQGSGATATYAGSLFLLASIVSENEIEVYMNPSGQYSTRRYITEGDAEIPSPFDYTEDVALYYKLANTTLTSDEVNLNNLVNDLTTRVEQLESKLNGSGISYVIKTLEGKGNNGESYWVRIYSDNWVEQGGISDIQSGNYATVKFPIPFENLNYNIIGTLQDATSYNGITNKSLTSVSFYKTSHSNAKNVPICWSSRGKVTKAEIEKFLENF